MTRRWWHCKVIGHPTQHEIECRAYDAARNQAYLERSLFRFPREWTNEFLGEPVPPLEIERAVIPMARSVGKSEYISAFCKETLGVPWDDQ